LWCFLPISERRFMELLLTVNFRVAQRDLCIERSGPAASPAPPSGDAMLVGARAGPDHPEMVARLAKFGPGRSCRPLQSNVFRVGIECGAAGPRL
jgi:hypothetical protein